MSERRVATPGPGLLEEYAQTFDGLWSKLSQRQGFRQYLAGLLLPAERNKTLTGLANTEPDVAAQAPRAQTLQWFLSESTWDATVVNTHRLELLKSIPGLAPHAGGVLVIDETGDRKDGHQTAHVGRQYLANVGKVDNGVVSVSSLWADEQVYYPVAVEPYTPAPWFTQGKADPAFRTKLKIAVQLVGQALRAGIGFRAVVADSFYGEDRGFRKGLEQLKVGYVLALKPSHAWRSPTDEIGSLAEAARAAGWKSARQPGEWVAVERNFRDLPRATWWALEVRAGPFGPQRLVRSVVVTTDPDTLPGLTTWYLITNLPVPKTRRAQRSRLAGASLAEVVRAYGLRHWVEQSYKQVKHALGWAEYQVRSNIAIRRHWTLVCCAFTFCWFQANRTQIDADSPKPDHTHSAWSTSQVSAKAAQPKKSGPAHARHSVVAQGAASSPGLARTLHNAPSLLAGVLATAPALSVATTA